MNEKSQAIMIALKSYSEKAGHFLTIPIVFGASICAAYYTAYFLQDIFRDKPIGVAAFGGGVLLATINGFAKSVPSIFEYIEEPSLRKLSIPCAALYIAAFSLTASIYVYKGSKDTWHFASPTYTFVNMTTKENSANQTREKVFNKVINLNFNDSIPPFFAGKEAILTFYLTFDGEATGTSLSKLDGSGLTLHEADQKLIRNLFNDLQLCSQGTDEKIEIAIRGYASSSDWQKTTKLISDQMNIDLANGRAEVVENFIKDEFDSSWINTRIDNWKNIASMEEARRFNDRIGEKYLTQRGRLNRRAEILLLGVADCQTSK